MALRFILNRNINDNAVFVQEFNPEPVIPIYTARPDQVEKALKHVYHACMNKLKGKELELLLAILPDNNGSLYGNAMKKQIDLLVQHVKVLMN